MYSYLNFGRFHSNFLGYQVVVKLRCQKYIVGGSTTCVWKLALLRWGSISMTILDTTVLTAKSIHSLKKTQDVGYTSQLDRSILCLVRHLNPSYFNLYNYCFWIKCRYMERTCKNMCKYKDKTTFLSFKFPCPLKLRSLEVW